MGAAWTKKKTEKGIKQERPFRNVSDCDRANAVTMVMLVSQITKHRVLMIIRTENMFHNLYYKIKEQMNNAAIVWRLCGHLKHLWLITKG